MNFDKNKFKNLILYIVWKCGDADQLGSTKLNKILWLCDSRAYMLNKKPITGAKYVKQKHGPVPKAVMPIRAEMEREGSLSIWPDPKFAGKLSKDLFKAKKRPDFSLFTPKEKQIIEFWIKKICVDHTAKSISEETHDYVWEIAKIGEEIPYPAVFATRLRPPNAKEMDWAKAEAEKLKTN